MIPSNINPLGIDRNYPLMNFEKDGNLFDISKVVPNDLKTAVIDSTIHVNFSNDIMGEVVLPLNTFQNLKLNTSHVLHCKIDTFISEYTGNIRNTLVFWNGITVVSAVDSNNTTGLGIRSIIFIIANDLVFDKVTLRLARPSDYSTISAVLKEFQLEEGSAATPYQPYNQHTYSVYGQSTQTGTPSPDNPIPIVSNYPKGVYKTNLPQMPYIRLYDDLRGIGTVRDKITVNVSTKEKLLTKKIGNKIFTGEDTFSYRSDIGSSDGFSRFYIGIPNRLAGNDKIIASHFKTIPSHTVLDNGLRNISDWVEFQINNSIIGAIVTDDTNTLINKFKAWLAVQYNVGTPLISQYQLATPINQPL